MFLICSTTTPIMLSWNVSVNKFYTNIEYNFDDFSIQQPNQFEIWLNNLNWYRNAKSWNDETQKIILYSKNEVQIILITTKLWQVFTNRTCDQFEYKPWKSTTWTDKKQNAFYWEGEKRKKLVAWILNDRIKLIRTIISTWRKCRVYFSPI